MDRIEYPAGSNQKIVSYVSSDDGGPVNFDELLVEFASHAAALERDGWQVVSTAALPMRQMGTAGNIFLQSGGQYATKAALAVTYARR